MLIVLRAAGPVAVLVALLAATTAAAALPPQVRAVLDGHGLDPDDLSIHVQELGSDREVLAHNADTPRNPASVLKLLTTFAALDELGPAHTWQTEVYLHGRIEDGVLDGDLILRGGGDPYLVQERFWLLLRELRRRGLERIEGDLILDTGYFRPGPEDRGAFDNQPLRAYNVTPHALLVIFNVVRFWFEPAADGVLVGMEPPLANLRVDNRLQPAAGRCRGYQRGIAVRAVRGAVAGDGRRVRRRPRGGGDAGRRRAVLHHDFTAAGRGDPLHQQVQQQRHDPSAPLYPGRGALRAAGHRGERTPGGRGLAGRARLPLPGTRAGKRRRPFPRGADHRPPHGRAADRSLGQPVDAGVRRLHGHLRHGRHLRPAARRLHRRPGAPENRLAR